MMNINVALLQWSKNFLIKNLLAAVLKIKLFPIKNYLKNSANQLLRNSRKERYNDLL